MDLSAEALADLATQTGYRVDTLEKVIRLGEVLADIERHALLSEVLVLKGGTALNLFPGPPTRLSVDLDFNYVGHVDRERMLQQRPDVERAMETIARGQRYAVQNSRQGHAGKKFYLSYRTVTGIQDRIELDLNYLFRIPLGRIRRSMMWQPGKLERPRTRLVAEEELLAGKLCALLDRVAPRDLFDIAHVVGQDASLIKDANFKKIFVALAGTLPHPLHTYGRHRLDKVTERLVRSQLGPMLRSDHDITADTLKKRTWTILAPLLKLSAAERQYTDDIDAGELHPELLFPARSRVVSAIRRHPALQWKIENARKKQRRKIK